MWVKYFKCIGQYDKILIENQKEITDEIKFFTRISIKIRLRMELIGELKPEITLTSLTYRSNGTHAQ